MRLLDLFCGAGGAAVGYHRAGFTEIVGVDIEPQPDYPFRFIQADAIKFLAAMWEGQEDNAYDLIHASPPCQAFSRITADNASHPDLVADTRWYLTNLFIPYVMENVPGAPIRNDLLLCGSHFGMSVQRHRIFEYGHHLPPALHPVCRHEWDDPQAPYMVTGHGGGWSPRHKNYRNFEHAKELMGMPWATHRKGVTEAIPPAYTEWIGRRLKAEHDVRL